jgi:membrane fusion protein, multidrug efflux system
MKIAIRLIIYALIIGLLIFIKIKYLTKEQPAAPMSAGKGGAPAANVMGYIAKPEKLDNKIFASGTLMPAESVDLKPEVAGKIVELNLPEGKWVNKGDLLLKLNDADLQTQIRKIETQMALSRQTEQRLHKLLDMKGISQEEYDVVVNQLNTYSADIEFVKAQIQKTELRAPFTGILGLRSVSLGSYVNAQSTIAVLQQVNPIKVDFSVPEKYAQDIHLGESVAFSIEGSNTVHTAKVYATETQIDPLTRTLKVRATASNAGNVLRPGAFAKVDLSLKDLNGALMIPTEAMIPILKGQQVYVARNGKATPIKIETGVRTEDKIQITAGLQIGDTIITTGIMGLKPNAPVKFTTIQ